MVIYYSHQSSSSPPILCLHLLRIYTVSNSIKLTWIYFLNILMLYLLVFDICMRKLVHKLGALSSFCTTLAFCYPIYVKIATRPFELHCHYMILLYSRYVIIICSQIIIWLYMVYLRPSNLVILLSFLWFSLYWFISGHDFTSFLHLSINFIYRMWEMFILSFV